jgi:hypothetical protein
MPLLQYFAWVGGFLLAALLAASWCISAPIALASRSDVRLDRKINILIHTDQKWPERVVFDTARSRLAPEATVDSETNNRRSETIAQAERQPFDAFAEMAAIPARPCFRPPCSSGPAADRMVSPTENDARSQNRSPIAARNGLTFPNRLHKPPGRS